MKQAFVTGGSGFVGQALIARLRERGVAVRALARSEASDRVVRAAGAVPVRGGLDDAKALTAGMRGCDVVFHVAGHLSEWDPYKLYFEANVAGTRNVIDAARDAGVSALVAVGASAVVMGRPTPMRHIDETLPLQGPSWGPYIATKAEAERLVRAANSPALRTVVVRPPFIWGRGMPMLDEIVKAAQSGQFALPDGGRQAMSTSHVDNVADCVIRAADNGRGGEVYHVADAGDTTLKEFVTALLATRGLPPITRSAPFAVAWRMAAMMEGTWRLFRLRSKPPVTRQTLRMIGQDFTIDTAKARRELGYAPVIGRAEGFELMMKQEVVHS